MRLIHILVLVTSFFASAQIDHWESVVLPGDQWDYLVPSSQPSSSWNQLGYNSSSWSTGNSGFGYGDGDDATIVSNTISIYIRKTFSITNLSDIEAIILDLDYDDGFVAYLNGQEVARNLISGSIPNFNQTSDGYHEALLPQGYAPERFGIDVNLLNPGTNVLAVQVHNQSFDSSDLSALPVFSVGINNTSSNYETPPSWFEVPYIPAEVNFESSNLPIVVIDTFEGQEIPNDPKIDATMKIIFRENQQRNFLTDVSDPNALDYDGPIKIEYRGSSSSLLDKKQYAFTPYDDLGEKINVPFLDMPTENDWILNGLAYDPSYMRDFLSYKLSNLIGNYASRGKYCELVLNGEFRGIYVLQEKLKADDSRIDIKKIKDDDLTLPKLTGGYITKTDKIEGSDTVAWGMDNYGGWQSNFVHEHPKSSEVMPEQHSYIENEFLTLQSYVNNPSNSSIIEGYPSIIDVPSFIDFIILNEISSNADGYEFSTFFHKDRNDKLRAGPIWDFNLTFGNDLFQWGYDRSHTDVWQFYDQGNMGPKFWKDLFDDSLFNCYLSKRWQELSAPGMPLNEEEIFELIDSIEVLILEAVERQEIVSGTTGVFTQNIIEMKAFISERIEWISNQLTDISLCDNIVTPEIVISKINYNPLVEADLDSSDFEFIELSNNSTSDINLTGIYFGGLGLTYQFAPGSSLPAQAVLFLANDSDSFIQRYGFEPFGEFSRSLSNDGEDLILRDAYGNIIDQVVYNDVLPWPEDADGEGSFLKLVSLSLDNSLASSWVARSDSADNLSVSSNLNTSHVDFYPNPVLDILKIRTNSGTINSVNIYGTSGKILKKYTFNQKSIELDLSAFESGLYVIQIQTSGELFVKKIVKN
ncbi:MAG: T9SS type A sorting domain-containing protein [Formosa sp.]|jgi:hypothetical protein|nr:T9SS type A sorting domain-containing protein [Formosa sp.]|tara:strand:- start:3698 stop:6298 length:2601 start_codon:yes stop_codon:yes gene_type:complete